MPLPAWNKHWLPIVYKLLVVPSLLPKVVILTLGQNTKQKSGNTVKSLGIVVTTKPSPQLLKAFAPKEVKLTGNSLISILAQYSKAFSPIEVIPLWRFTSFKAVA